MTEISDSPSVPVPALYTHDVVGLTDYFVSETIWCALRRVVAVEVTDIVYSDAENETEIALFVITRKSGGSWMIGQGGYFYPFNPAIVSSRSGGYAAYTNSICQPTTLYTVLDETRIVFTSGNQDAYLAASVSVPGLPNGDIHMQMIPAGGFGNLFGIEGVVVAEPRTPMQVDIIDDPDRPGHYLFRLIPATDNDGNVLSSLQDFTSGPIASSFLASGFFSGSGVNGAPAAALTDGFPYVAFAGGDSGDPPPVSFKVTVR